MRIIILLLILLIPCIIYGGIVSYNNANKLHYDENYCDDGICYFKYSSSDLSPTWANGQSTLYTDTDGASYEPVWVNGQSTLVVEEF